MKKIIILGSTGSVGQNALRVVKALPGEFRVVGLSCDRNVIRLARQMRAFGVRRVAIRDRQAALRLKTLKGLGRIQVYSGPNGAAELVRQTRADKVLTSIVGAEGLLPIVEAIKKQAGVAIANKEPLVMAGELITRLARRHAARLLPVDSEHSAIFQCLNGTRSGKIRRLLLTGTGGPFLRANRRFLRKVSVRQAVRHPKWKMGKKISVDSATLMNKGLEIIEAQWLFGVHPEKIDIVIHPEAVIHSMVEFVDGAILAQLGLTDMRIPIQYALTFPQRLPSALPQLNFARQQSFTFEEPDFGRFPCLGLAREAARLGGTAPVVLNAANEIAVDAFLKKDIPFLGIARVIAKVMKKHRPHPQKSLNTVLTVDRWAREEAKSLV